MGSGTYSNSGRDSALRCPSAAFSGATQTIDFCGLKIPPAERGRGRRRRDVPTKSKMFHYRIMDPKLICTSIAVLLFAAATARAEDKVPLKTELPKPMFVGTPVPAKLPNLEPPRQGKRPDFLVPAGTKNLAAGKKVTASDTEPVVGTLDLITDGDKAGDEGSWVELGPGKQWIQIDLGQSAGIYAVLVWHFHSEARVYRGVVVQISDDPKFEKNVATVFNNDYENALGLGAGKDLAYVESYEGKLVDAKGVKGRYVRLYSNGNTTNKLNHYIEVEVFGKPAS